MATAAPHVKLLRQLASAKDDYLSGAFDITWDGAKATLYLVFGRPSHAVFETDQASIEGEAAIDALLSELPRTFVVSDWRRAMSPQETLSITIDELAGPFVRLAGSYADDPVTEEAPEWWSASDDAPDLAFGIADFPLLPGGRPLWAETSPEDVHLAEQLADLPPSILILTGAKLRAAAVVSGGDIIDAVWIDADDQARGEAAGMAILGATKGSLAGYALDDPRVAEALTMLWRLPLAVSGVELSWLDPASMLAAFRADGLDRVLVIDAPVRGIALFSRGGLVAVYSETQRSAVASPERLRSLLSQARGRLSVMERKPRPLETAAAQVPLNAFEFFEVEALGPEAQATPSAGAALDVPVAEPAEAWAATPPPPPIDAAPAAPTDLPAAAEEVAEPAPAASDVEPPPPPPPPDAPPDAASTPAPSAPDAVPAPRKAKRSWWLFGTSRRGRSAAPDGARVEPTSAGPEAEPDAGANFNGWSVRRQGATSPPPREKSPAPVGGADDVHDQPAPAPAPAADAAGAEAGAVEGSPVEQQWSVRTPTGAEAEGAAPAKAASEPPPDDPLDFWGTGALHADAAPEGERTSAGADDAAAPAEGESHVGPDADAAHADVTAAAEDAASPAVEQEPALVTEPVAAHDVGGQAEPAHDDEVAAVGELAKERDDAAAADEHDIAADEHDAAADEHDIAADEHDIAAEAEPATDHAQAASEPAGEVADEGRHDNEDGLVAAGAGDSEQYRRPTAVGRNFAPWSWPLAEPSLPSRARASGSAGTPLEPLAAGGTGSGALEDQQGATLSGDAGFFSRDDPVGSQYVDFDEVRTELVQIGIVWLGEANAAPVTALLTRTRSTIDDFVAAIDTIRGLHLEGQDPASIQAMAREMHQQAAERLCGA